MPHFGDYQNEIYFGGLSGVMPKWPVDFAGIEKLAHAAMAPGTLSYVAGGCGDEHTQDWNAAAFRHWGMVPRMMVDCRERDLSVEVFGQKFASPLFMSPVGVVGLITEDQHGDLAAARASAATGVPLCQSTLGNDTLEDVAAACGDTPALFQLYTPRDRDLAASIVSRAEAAGYKAIVVTLDTWLTGWRPRDLNTGNFPQLRGVVLENYFSDPAFQKLLAKPVAEDRQAAVTTWAANFGHVPTFDDLKWLKSLTSLPLVLKGICHPDDAARALDLGADGIYVSNHGGRQANGGVAAIDCLPKVAERVAGRAPILFDSGIRSGSDVVKAVALGADLVGVGRPYAYGLALGGSEGCAHVLKSILAEADLMMAVNGMPDLAAIRAEGATRQR